MKVYVNIFEPDGIARRFSVEDRPVKIGRSKTVQVHVRDDLCSGIHAMLYVKAGNLYIEDLASKNGIFLNGIKIQKQKLYLGDELYLGETRIEVDQVKNPPEVLSALSSEKRRLHGEITLQLETRQERTRSKKINQIPAGALANGKEVASSKLYEGAEAAKKVTPTKRQSNPKVAFVKKITAKAIDLIVSMIAGTAGHLLIKNVKPELGEPALILIAVAVGIGFFYWNRNRAEGSIGEKIMGIG